MLALSAAAAVAWLSASMMLSAVALPSRMASQ
jgi:hypothetical protein